MPRLKRTITTAERRLESSKRYYQKGVYDWVDPFPLVFGTLPEKMVYAMLTYAGIPFYYLNDISFFAPEIDFFKEYQADFIIPSVKVIIEVQGAYWHSKPAAIEADSFKMSVYESFGYKAYAWWDYDIESNLAELMGQAGILLTAPRLKLAGGQSAELTPMKRTKTDTSKGIRTMNARKKKPYRTFVGTGRRKVRKVQSSYGTR